MKCFRLMGKGFRRESVEPTLAVALSGDLDGF